MTGESTAAALLWGERPAPTRGPKPTLTLEEIAAVGIAMADADGLPPLTMQRVAERLGVTKMALYRYVPSKVELIAVMIDLGLGEAPRLDTIPGGWRAKLGHWAGLIFERFSAHPWALDVTLGARVIGPNELGWLEQAVGTFTGTGLSGRQMLDVAATVVGHVRMIAQQTAAAGRLPPEQAMDHALEAVLIGRESRFPALAAALAEPTGTDHAFGFGLQLIFDGIELLIERLNSGEPDRSLT